MPGLDAYLLTQHPEDHKYLTEILERTLRLLGITTHSVGSFREFMLSGNILPRPDIILVDWNFRGKGDSSSTSTPRFGYLHAIKTGAPIIAFSTQVPSDADIKTGMADSFVWTELKHQLDDSRYITGNATILADRLSLLISKRFKLTLPTSPATIHRYRSLENRGPVPDMYKDYTEPPAPVGFVDDAKPTTTARVGDRLREAVPLSTSSDSRGGGGSISPRIGAYVDDAPLSALNKRIGMRIRARRQAAIELASRESAAALIEMTAAALEQDKVNRPNGTRSLNGSRCEM